MVCMVQPSFQIVLVWHAQLPSFAQPAGRINAARPRISSFMRVRTGMPPFEWSLIVDPRAECLRASPENR